MISIQIDVSPALSELLHQPNGLVQRAGRLAILRAAEEYSDAVHEYIRAHHPFTPRTGRLEQETGWHPTGMLSAQIYSNAPYAGYVEEGTAPHVIQPRDGRQALRFFMGGPSGGMMIRRQVRHPGTRARPFFFADLAGRQGRMLRVARDAVGEVLGGAH